VEKGARLKELGADFVFDPAAPDLRKAVLAAIAPKKVDLVVENIGGPLFNEVLAMLGYAGRISVVGRSGGPVPEFNTASLFFRRNRIGGVAVSDFTREAAQSAWKEIVGRIDAMGKRPVVDRVFPFDETKQAFARLAQGPLGKVVIRVGAGS
jgi:NADPH2:quinone reductase